MKICVKCNINQPVENYYKQTGKRTKEGYRRPTCKSCVNKSTTQWAKENPEKTKEIRRKAKLKRNYGISIEAYDAMVIKHNNKCAICHQEHKRRPLNVDHCHTTGKVRGLLCDKCNMALGLLNDSKELINNLGKYLDAYLTA